MNNDSKTTMKVYGSEDMQFTAENLPPVLKWVTPNSKVLEFGPAYGYMTRYMKEQLHCEVVCVELNPEMKVILEKYARKVIIGNLDDDEWTKEIDDQFDFIIFADVLEHLRNPQMVLKKAVQYGDCVLTSIPNIGHASIILGLLDGQFNYTKMGLLDDSHIHFFTRKSVIEMATSCGLIPVAEDCTTYLYPSVTEQQTSYRHHLGAAWLVARKRDSVVYQFVNCWKKEGTSKPVVSKGVKLSVFQACKVIVLDCIRDFVGKHDIKSNALKKIWHKIM